MDGRCFHTFVVADRADAAGIASISVADDWALSTHDDPSQRHWDTGTGICTLKHRDFVPQGAAFTEKYAACREVIVCAKDENIATNVQSLVYGGILLAYPDLLSSKTPPNPIAVGTLSPELLVDEPFCRYFAHHDNALYGCTVASKAWLDCSIIYAIEKLKLSLSLDWFTLHSASPRHGQIFSNEHPEFSYHVNAAYAIVTAFAAVEELGLDVRSSQQKPRFVGQDKDTWNPDVKRNLIDRLNAAGIDDNETVLWVHRGAPTPVEDEAKPKLGTAASYSDSDVVRDRELQLIDAIHYASWLRNFVAAHKFGALTESLSPYDVHNVQLLARRLILGKLNLWKSWPPTKNGS